MRILVISNLFPPEVRGGYEILCEQVSTRLHQRGHQVQVLTTPFAAPESVPYPVLRDLRLYLPFSEPAGFHRWRRVSAARYNHRITRRVLGDFRPDLVFVWSQLRLTTGAARAAESSGVPVAYTMNDEHLAGYASPGRSPKAWLRRLLDERILRIGLDGLRLANSTCISRTVRDRLVHAGVPVNEAQVIFQGIPVERFPSKSHPGAVASPARVLYVGQLHEYKGVHTVITAVQALHAAGVPISLTICGAGDAPYEERLRQLAAASSAPVSFLGKLGHEQLPRIYRSHDIFVFPSTWAEPFGLTHLEAMASGTPVVSTAAGGHGEFLRHGVNALVFSPGSDTQLANHIQTLLQDPDLAARLAQQALRQVHTEFSLDSYVGRLEQWLLQVQRGQSVMAEASIGDGAASSNFAA